MKKAVIICVLVLLLLTGCKKDGDVSAQTPTPTIEVEANDYNGAILRIDKLVADAHTIINQYTEKVKSVMETNPTDYWNIQDFFSINLEFLDNWALQNTGYFNERSDWNETYNLIYQTFLNADGKPIVDDLNIIRNSSGDYNIFYNAYLTTLMYGYAYTSRRIECIYDAGHDWLRTYVKDTKYNNTISYLDGIFEYARYGNTFLIQTQTERLVLIYDDNNTLNKFYYSKLSSKKDRAKYHPYIYVTEETESDQDIEPKEPIVQYVDIDTTGLLLNQYNEDDTIFTRFSRDSLETEFFEWVMEEPTALINVIYDNGILSVTQTNELSGKNEIFSVDMNGKVSREIKPISDEIFGMDITEYETTKEIISSESGEGLISEGEDNGNNTNNIE